MKPTTKLKKMADDFDAAAKLLSGHAAFIREMIASADGKAPAKKAKAKAATKKPAKIDKNVDAQRSAKVVRPAKFHPVPKAHSTRRSAAPKGKRAAA